MPKKYIMSAHENARNLFRNALGMTINKWNKGKRRVDPVFKSERQRKSFKRESIAARTQLLGQIAANPFLGVGADPRVRKLRAIRKLNRLAQPRTALRSFGGDNRTRPTIYVQGHGTPGATGFLANPAITGAQATRDDLQGFKTVRQTSMTLKRMDIPERAKIRANSCFSATQNRITRTQATFHFTGGGNPIMAPQSGPPLATYAGNLANELRNVGRTYPQIEVSGYLSGTTQFPQPTVHSNLVTPVNAMGVRFRPPPVGPDLLVKRGDAKRPF